MDEKKQTAFVATPVPADAIPFWGTIAHAAVLLALSFARFNALYAIWNGTAVFYAALSLVVLTGVMNLASLAFTLRGAQDVGYRLSYFSAALAVVGLTAVLRDRLLSLVLMLLILSAFGISWLCPRALRRFYALSTLIAIGLATAIEWLAPKWRISYPEAQVSVPLLVAFGVIFILAAAAQVWRSGGSIRNKLVVAFLAITLIPLGIIGYISYASSTASLTDAANQKLRAAAETTAVTLDRFILNNLEHIRAVAQFPAIVEYLSLPPSRRAGSEQERRALDLITTMAREDPVFISSIALFDIGGIDLLDTDANDVGLNKSDRAYFRNVLQTGLPYVSDVEFQATTRVPSIYFAAPTRDATGKIIGVLRVRYNANILQRFITAGAGLAGETSYPILLDSNHVHLAHGLRRDWVYKSIVPLSISLVAELQSKGLLPKGTPAELATDLNELENGLNNFEQQPYFASDADKDGAREQVAAARMTTKPWLVVFVQDEAVFLAPIQRQTFNSLLVIAFIAAAVGVIGVVFSQTISGPLSRLTSVAEAIAAGDVNIHAEVETTDEIGVLARTFNRMTQQLREFITSLEERVAARTKDLATVARVSTQAAAILDPFQMLATAVHLTQRGFGLYHAHVFTYDKDSDLLSIVACGYKEGDEHEGTHGTTTIPLQQEQSLVARAARTRQPVIVNDVRSDPGWLPNPLLPDTRAELAVPMIVGDELLGVLDVQSDRVGAFTEESANIQLTLSAQLATALKNAQAYSAAKSQAEFEALASDVVQKIQRAATLEDTLQTVVRELGVALGAPKVAVKISAKQGAHEQNQN